MAYFIVHRALFGEFNILIDLKMHMIYNWLIAMDSHMSL